MDDLWAAIGELAAGLNEHRVGAMADAIRRLESVDEFAKARPAFGLNADQEKISRLESAWSNSPDIQPREIAAALWAAVKAADLVSSEQSIDLVWTGPKTDLIPTRSTEQAILEVVESASEEVFVVSYAFYKATSILEGLASAVMRGVRVRILLESSIEHGGTVKGDNVDAIAKGVPGAEIYIWDTSAKRMGGDGLTAAVHAKCAVADGGAAFITSANLTSAALERNMELGVLIRGGEIPKKLQTHLDALITTRVITRNR